MTVGKVQTVLGDIDGSEMGFTLPHEHILTCPQGHGSKAEENHHLDSIPKGIQMLKEFKESGGMTIVETTPKTWGRNTPGMVECSQATGVHVIACTGYICEEHGMEPEVSEHTQEYIESWLRHDITVGMDGTTVKAGYVKMGTAYMHITPNEHKCLKAAAKVAMETGVCLHLHTTGGTMGIEQCEILQDTNFDMSRLIIAHVDRCPDPWYHRKMLETGASLIYDGPGKAKYFPDNVRVDLIKQMIAEGFEDQLMLSNDMGHKKHHKVYGYGPGFTWIKERFLPRLIEEGVSQKTIDKMMIHNPRRLYQMVK